MTSVRCRYGILTTCLIMLCTLAAAQSIDVTTDNTNPEIGENIEFVIRANAQGVNLNAVAVYLDLTNDFALEGDIFVNESDWDLEVSPRIKNGKLDMAVALKGGSSICGGNCEIARFVGSFSAHGTKNVSFSASNTRAARRPDFQFVNFASRLGTTIVVGPGHRLIAVDSPNGGETWFRGKKQQIKWSSTGDVGDVRIDLYRKGNLEQQIIDVTPNDGKHKWKVPAKIKTGKKYTVRITSTSDPKIEDISDAQFSIKESTKSDEPKNLSDDGITVKEATTPGSPGAARPNSRNNLTDGFGVCKVKLRPRAACAMGAKWRIDDGEWCEYNPGEKGLLVPVGAHSIEFNEVSGWISPKSQQVHIQESERAKVTGKFTEVEESP